MESHSSEFESYHPSAMNTTNGKLQPEIIHNTEDLLKFHEACCHHARELMRKKNHDYSGVVDVMQNFRMFEELGIVVRMGDKLSRLKSWVEKGQLTVTDESVEDTALDVLNYAILLLAYGREARTKRQRNPMFSINVEDNRVGGFPHEPGCTHGCERTLSAGVHYSTCALYVHTKEVR